MIVNHLEKIVQAAVADGWAFHGASNTIHVGLLFSKNDKYGTLVVARHDLGFFIVNEGHGIRNKAEWLSSKYNSAYYASIADATVGLLSLVTKKDARFEDLIKERLPEDRASTYNDWPQLMRYIS
jgi:hypothetical protein